MREAFGPHVLTWAASKSSIPSLRRNAEKVRSFFQKPSFKYRSASRLIAGLLLLMFTRGCRMSIITD
jgi:hypothetical protein